MSWRTDSQAIPNSPRDFAEKLDALGWNGISKDEQLLVIERVREISAFLPEAKGKALLTIAGIASKEWAPSPEKKGGKYALIERIKEKAIRKRRKAAERANLEED